MGKKKFISNKAVVIKLAGRDPNDPNRTEENKNLPTYEIVSYPNDERLNEEAIAKRDRILNAFDDTDQGLYDYDEAEEYGANPSKKELLDQVEGKSGLWIHTLQKMKAQNIKEKLLETGEYEDVEIQEKEEEGDYDDEDYDEEDEEEEKSDNNRKYIKLGDFQGEQEETKEKELTAEEKAEQLFNIDDDIDYKNIDVKEGVKFKKMNEYGLPQDDGFDYSKYIADPTKSQGKLVASFTANYDVAPKVTPDVDYELSEMTAEQKEVFESLQNEAAYEDLDDDFIQMAQEGEECIQVKEQPGKKKKKKERKIIPFVGEVIDEEEYNKASEQKYNDLMADEEFDEDEFKKAMDMYDECDQEEQLENKISKNELNDILDDHISDINKRNIQNKPQLEQSEKSQDGGNKENFTKHSDLPLILQSLQQRIQQREEEELEKKRLNGELDEEKKDKVLPQYNVKQRMREERAVKVFDRDAAKKKFKEIYGDEFKDKDHVAPLSIEEDTALQNYMKRTEEQEEREQKFLDKKFEEKMFCERKLDETIATKSFSKSTVHEHLNVIDEQGAKKKKSKKLKEHEKREELERTQQILEDQDAEDDGEFERIKDVSAIFTKRGKEETEEERKLRKKLVKEFNKQRKEQKRMFKQGVDDLTKAKQGKIKGQTQAQQNMRGVSVVKL